jgi:hypothetical protein
MTQPNPTQSNPWLQLAIEALQLIKKEPPEVQKSLRRMGQKTYPETAKALAEQEERQ